MERLAIPTGGMPCPGCPIYPHIRDEEFRFPSCELCHWPAVGIGSRHVWRCASCRHRNEHGLLRPRVVVVLLRLADVDPAAHRLRLADPRYGHYLIPPTNRSHHRPGAFAGPSPANSIDPARILPDDSMHPIGAGGPTPTGPFPAPAGPAAAGGIGRPADGLGGPGQRRVAVEDRAGRPVYARATVAGLPVLIVGGDRPYPHPLGLAEHDPEPCSFATRATRIACPCDQPPPCLHGQALYAHVVAPVAIPAGLAPSASELVPCGR